MASCAAMEALLCLILDAKRETTQRSPSFGPCRICGREDRQHPPSSSPQGTEIGGMYPSSRELPTQARIHVGKGNKVTDNLVETPIIAMERRWRVAPVYPDLGEHLSVPFPEPMCEGEAYRSTLDVMVAAPSRRGAWSPRRDRRRSRAPRRPAVRGLSKGTPCAVCHFSHSLRTEIQSSWINVCENTRPLLILNR